MSKYTKDKLQEVANKSVSVAQMLREFGIKECGGNYAYFKRLIEKEKIDTSHFLGQRANSGTDHKGGPEKRHWTEILVLKEPDSKVYNKEKTRLLKRALIESGRTYRCESCDLPPIWNGKELVLQVDHRNGDTLDNRKENLRFLCPNCHTQTENWGCKKNAVVA